MFRFDFQILTFIIAAVPKLFGQMAIRNSFPLNLSLCHGTTVIFEHFISLG